MKNYLLTTLLFLSTVITLSAQDAQVTQCYFYQDENNRFSNVYEIINLRPDDTMTFVEFKFCLFSSLSDLHNKRFHIVPLYNTMNLEHVPGNCAFFSVMCNTPYGKKVKIDNVEWKQASWYTKMDDVIGARILEVEVTYASGHVVKLDGYPKNSRVRKGDEHPPFIL